jgi:ABC-type lipoprotein release transport system permease subunit
MQLLRNIIGILGLLLGLAIGGVTFLLSLVITSLRIILSDVGERRLGPKRLRLARVRTRTLRSDASDPGIHRIPPESSGIHQIRSEIHDFDAIFRKNDQISRFWRLGYN